MDNYDGAGPMEYYIHTRMQHSPLFEYHWLPIYSLFVVILIY